MRLRPLLCLLAWLAVPGVAAAYLPQEEEAAALERLRSIYAQVLAAEGVEATPAGWTAALAAPAARVREAAAFLLGMSRDPAAVAPLRRALADPDASARLTVVQALLLLDDGSGLAAVEALLRAPELPLRARAVDLFARHAAFPEHRSAVAARLAELLRDPAPQVRSSAAAHLAAVGGAGAVPALAAALAGETDRQVRLVLETALGRLRAAPGAGGCR